MEKCVFNALFTQKDREAQTKYIYIENRDKTTT